MEPDYATDEDDAGYNTVLFPRAKDALVAFVQAPALKKAIKACLGAFLFFSLAACMVLISSGAYGILYYNYIPQVDLERIVHLQFGDGHPWGVTPLGRGLVSLQPYDIHVELELPRTPANLATGNFMLDLTLFPHDSESISNATNAPAPATTRSRRPAILSYTSPLVDTATKVSLMPLYVLGWKRETEKLKVQMMEQVEFARGWRNLPDSLRLEIQSQEKMQIYRATVKFRARFTGMLWLMYNWRITSFVVFTFMFWSTSMITMSTVFLAVSHLAKQGQNKEIKKEQPEGVRIKEEPSDDSTSPLETESDSRKDQPDTKVKEDDAHSADDESEDLPHGAGPSNGSGIGTGLESAEAQGVQRRRSFLAG